MSEEVVITPQAGLDAYDDLQAAGDPITVRGLVAPGDTTTDPGADGSLDQVEFTVYLPLRIKQDTGWVRTLTALTDNFTITVRGQDCVGRAKEWDESGRGGVEIVATAKTGATP